MLVAGFVDGCLIYIFKFSFNEQSFTSRLQEQLKRNVSLKKILGLVFCVFT